ncbi:MAG: ferritin family protein [Deltaproteobacteria bacterium]|nr:ferritin family protein [Deltaproteobacteria bacterium]
MSIIKALKTAIAFEVEVRGVYAEAVKRATDPVGRRVFALLASEEQNHVRYLEGKLADFARTGKVVPGEVRTALPKKVAIAAKVRELKKGVAPAAGAAEVEMLARAFEMEQETSAFYRRMVAELDAEGQAFFRPFVEIEEGHLALVGAEKDAVAGFGYWFDMPEFDLEAG